MLLKPAFVLLASLLTGCAHTPAVPPPATIFQDVLFAPPAHPIRAADVFAFTPAMQDYLDKQVMPQLRSRGQRQGLVDALYTRGRLKLDYDTDATRNAAQAFEARSGNCLSLVIMTGAFAKQLGLSVRFQSVYVEEAWSRSGGIAFLSGHVNLALGVAPRDPHSVAYASDLMTVDFLPAESIRGQRVRVIEEATIVAMYMNNRAAENLNDGYVDEAYWWAREALLQDPKFITAFNTLGVIYRRHGNIALAEQALRHVLAQEPDNVQAMSNLVIVLKEQNRLPEAAVLQAQLQQLQPVPPFKYFDDGVLAMKNGDYQEAKRLFEKEIARSAYFHEFYFGLALANYGLGDWRGASKALTLADENSTTRESHRLYAAKLAWLKAQRPSLH
jgi:tetratricopeptide (TPR) repeat protein